MKEQLHPFVILIQEKKKKTVGLGGQKWLKQETRTNF